jgi:HSP20 family protein
MAIVRWDPWNLSPRWGFKFPSFWNDDEDWFDASEGLAMYETNSNVVVKAAVPGVPADKVDVTIENGTLIIKAEMKENEEEKKKKKVVYKGSKQAKFFYQTSLPTSVKANKAEAEINDGMVCITIPKTDEAKPKKISVKRKSK